MRDTTLEIRERISKEGIMKRTYYRKSLMLLMAAILTVTTCVTGEQTYAKDSKEETKQVVKQVNMITNQKVEFKGDNLNLTGQKIKLVGPRGDSYEANYDDKAKVFVITKGELTVGLPYVVRADFATIPKAYECIYAPRVAEVKLVSGNVLEVAFDQPVDLKSGTNPSNYWIRTSEAKPTGIATLGKDDKTSSKNALTAEMVTIAPKDGSNKVMVFTFKDQATPKVSYSLVPCFVNMPGSEGYRGGNFTSASRLDFKLP